MEVEQTPLTSSWFSAENKRKDSACADEGHDRKRLCATNEVMPVFISHANTPHITNFYTHNTIKRICYNKNTSV